jgi:hypothetical protein
MTYKIPDSYPIYCKSCGITIKELGLDYYGLCFECYLEKNISNDKFDPYYEPHDDEKSILYDDPDKHFNLQEQIEIELEEMDEDQYEEYLERRTGSTIEDDYSEESYP